MKRRWLRGFEGVRMGCTVKLGHGPSEDGATLEPFLPSDGKNTVGFCGSDRRTCVLCFEGDLVHNYGAPNYGTRHQHN